MLIIPPLPARRPRKTEPLPPPASPALVVSAVLSGDGAVCTLAFDRPIALAGPPPASFDDAILFESSPPLAVERTAPAALTFTLDKPLEPGGTWAIGAQPAWLATPLAVPQAGTV